MVVGAAKQTNGVEGGGRGNMERGKEGRAERRERKAVQASVLDLWLKGCHSAFCTAKSFYTHCACVFVCACVCGHYPATWHTIELSKSGRNWARVRQLREERKEE